MNQDQLGMLIGSGVILVSILCGIILIFASMRSSQEEEKNEQNSSGMDQGDY